MSDNTKLLKFTILVEDINKVMEPTESIMSIISYQLNAVSGVRSPLRLVVDSKKSNEYSNIILNNAKFRLDDWSEYINGKNINDLKEKISATQKLIEILRQNERQALNFIFWLLFISTVDNTDYDERVSAIADFSHMIGLSDEIVKDLTQVVKVVLGYDASEIEFKTDEVRKNFKILIMKCERSFRKER